MVALAAEAGGIEARFTVMGKLMMTLGGLFIPEARASVEMLYEFTEPFVVDGSRFVQAFGVQPTPVVSGVAETVAWYQTRS